MDGWTDWEADVAFFTYYLGHGKCDCGKCKCEEGWFGDACQYPMTCNLTRKKSNEMCKNSQDIICSNAGEIFILIDWAMESVTVETVTVMLVGMAINVNSSVTSPHGRSRGGARLQMAKSAAIEAPVYVENAHVMMLTRPETGVIFMVTPVSVMNETARHSMTDTQMTFVPVRGMQQI
ncbi:hypothetical protein lerEdw1_011288 [Lerista edwardsae]|nr:hypothetical protein lerEdw1_011288 [Lerista edwardsae]